jgi:hypothetical protein
MFMNETLAFLGYPNPSLHLYRVDNESEASGLLTPKVLAPDSVSLANQTPPAPLQ